MRNIPGIFHISRDPARVTSAPSIPTQSFLCASGSATIMWMWPIEIPLSFGTGSWAKREAVEAANTTNHRMGDSLSHDRLLRHAAHRPPRNFARWRFRTALPMGLLEFPCGWVAARRFPVGVLG